LLGQEVAPYPEAFHATWSKAQDTRCGVVPGSLRRHFWLCSAHLRLWFICSPGL